MNNAPLLVGKSSLAISLMLLISCACSGEKGIVRDKRLNKDSFYNEMSIEIIENIKNDKSISLLKKQLASLDPDTLAHYLQSDNQKKAFWINIYNAYIQILLQENPELYDNREKFFSSKQIPIAKQLLSFDDIEHGFIRSSKLKLSLGFVRNPFSSEIEMKFRTKKTDGRIHFALNCGAKSCPKITVFSANEFEDQIDRQAKSFLKSVSSYDAEENKVSTTALFSWFRGDFGGKKGTINYLKEYEVIPISSYPSVRYNTYDWTLNLGNYYDKK